MYPALLKFMFVTCTLMKGLLQKNGLIMAYKQNSKALASQKSCKSWQVMLVFADADMGVTPVELIPCSVHSFAQFGLVTPQASAPQHWDTFSVLDHCHTFFVNPFSDRHNYLLFAQ